MIRCNNCMSAFEFDEDLDLIIDIQVHNEAGEWLTYDKHLVEIGEAPPIETEDLRFETFRGCPYCLDDAYLMDLSPYETAV